MNVAESKRIRHLVLHVERGEELPVALIRALHDAEAKSAQISGVGIVEAVELATLDPQGQSVALRIDKPALVVSLRGNVATEDGATNVHLYATLARQTELGQQTFAGHVRWLRASALDLFVTVYDDLTLERLTDEQGFPVALHATQKAPTTTATRVVQEEPAREVIAAPAVVAPAKPTPAAAPAPAPVPAPAPAREPEIDQKPALAPPVRISKPHEDTTEVYPEVGDVVTHFHFGECEVIGSDGERIRLRQIKDGRVREVSLAMLKISGPTIEPDSNKRVFNLARKN